MEDDGIVEGGGVVVAVTAVWWCDGGMVEGRDGMVEGGSVVSYII